MTKDGIDTDAGGSPFDDDRASVSVEVDFNGTAPPSVVLVEAIATARDIDPLALEPLAEVVDPEGLDVLLNPENGANVVVQFEYHGDIVTVDAAGHVTVSPGYPGPAGL